ncbi:MAG: hypothetical protein ACKO37_00435 [Vampirovibrionales bacterium]
MTSLPHSDVPSMPHAPEDVNQGLRLMVIAITVLISGVLFAFLSTYQWTQTAWQTLPVQEAVVKGMTHTQGHLPLASGIPSLQSSCILRLEVILENNPQQVEVPCEREIAIKTDVGKWRHPNTKELRVGDVIQLQHQDLGVMHYWRVKE